MKLRFNLHKKWIILGVASTVGILAALTARSYLSTQMAAIEARGKIKTVPLIVAKQELKRGDRLSRATVAVRDIPIDFAQKSAIAPEHFDRVDGQPLAYPVHAGDMILWGVLEGKKAPTFSARVEAGHRAMTVSVDEINSISGLLEPGDWIDLLVTVDQKGRRLTRPLLQNVQVMATGQRVVDSPREGERRHYSTVTIDITPAQAQQVILARDAGRITALLRNPEDRNRLSAANADMTTLLAGTAPKATVGDAGVPVLYGGAAKLTPEALTMGHAPGTTGVPAANLAGAPAAPDAIAASTGEAGDRLDDRGPGREVPVLSGRIRAPEKIQR